MNVFTKIPRILLLIVVISKSNDLYAQSSFDKVIVGHRIYQVINNRYTNSVKMIVEHKDGKYWVYTSWGLFLYSERTDDWKNFGGVIEMTGIRAGKSHDGKLWYAPYIYPPGLLVSCDEKRCETPDGKIKELNLIPSTLKNSNNYIGAIFPSNHGKLWVGVGNKLTIYDSQKWHIIFSVSDSQTSTSLIRAGLQDKNRKIWLSVDTRILELNENTLEYKAVELPKSFSYMDMVYEDWEGKIWFTNTRGEVYVRDRNGDWTSYILTKNLFNNSKDQKSDNPIFDAQFSGIKSIYKDRHKQVMFATWNGLVIFDESQNRWKILNHQNSVLPDNYINSITEDSEGKIWIGTGKGIVVLAP